LSTQSIIDAHLHLDDRLPGHAVVAVKALLSAMEENGIVRAVVLHLASQRWPAAEVAEAIGPHTGQILGFVNVNPTHPDASNQLEHGIRVLGFKGLKLHPRLQRFSATDSRTLNLVRMAGDLEIPVIIDAFPDGDWLTQGFNPLDFAALGRACPRTRIVIGHMGGHRVLDFMMLAKRIPNLFFDLSFSLLYYRGSSVCQDIIYAIRSMKGQRIFYGSDYPDRPLGETLAESVAVLQAGGLSPDLMERVLYVNAKEFFGWNDI
jgi:predicted TIM-barrel fold metal-dependent hydrolase